MTCTRRTEESAPTALKKGVAANQPKPAKNTSEMIEIQHIGFLASKTMDMDVPMFLQQF